MSFASFHGAKMYGLVGRRISGAAEGRDRLPNLDLWFYGVSQTMPSRTLILLLGLTATAGGFLAVLSDYYGLWTGHFEMSSPFSIGASNVEKLLASKDIKDLASGSYIGQFFIPLHAAGGVLMYFALAPASRTLALTVAALTIYTAAIGAAFHGSILFSGALAKHTNLSNLPEVIRFSSLTAYAMMTLILVGSTLIAYLILTGKSVYPRWSVLVSPFGLIGASTMLFFLLPQSARDIKEFLAISAFNLPMMIFHGLTTIFIFRSQRLRTIGAR